MMQEHVGLAQARPYYVLPSKVHLAFKYVWACTYVNLR